MIAHNSHKIEIFVDSKKKKKIDSYETKKKKESKGLEVKLFESSTSFERRVSKRKFGVQESR